MPNLPKIPLRHFSRTLINRVAMVALPLGVLALLTSHYAPAYGALLASKALLVAGRIDPAAIAIFAPLCLLMLAIIGLVLAMMMRGTAPDADERPYARGIPHWEAGEG